jgi:hypothetical protein
MDPIIVPVLTVLVGAIMRVIAFAELLTRLRWQERQHCADRSSLAELARMLPPGCQLDEMRADGSELHLVTPCLPVTAERPST